MNTWLYLLRTIKVNLMVVLLLHLFAAGILSPPHSSHTAFLSAVKPPRATEYAVPPLSTLTEIQALFKEAPNNHSDFVRPIKRIQLRSPIFADRLFNRHLFLLNSRTTHFHSSRAPPFFC